jgi:serine protease Do
VIATAEQAVVRVRCTTSNGETTASGTGFKAASNGYIVTAAHAVRACSQNGTVRAGTQEGFLSQFDPTHDLAFVNSPDSNTPPQLPLANGPPTVGESVAILGYPGSTDELETQQATISGINETATTNADPGYSETLTDAIAVNNSIGRGGSGGPAINARGEVVGVVEIGTPEHGTGYLTPASDISAEPTPP